MSAFYGGSTYFDFVSREVLRCDFFPDMLTAHEA